MSIFRAKLISLSNQRSEWVKKDGKTFCSNNPWSHNEEKPKIGGWYEIQGDNESPRWINNIKPCVCRECGEWTGSHEMLCTNHYYRCRAGCTLNRVRHPSDYCVRHTGKCQCCDAKLFPSETYCSAHKNPCPIRNCSLRMSDNENYCIWHQNSCQFEGCGERIGAKTHRDSDYCGKHTFEEQARIYKLRLENETSRANNLRLEADGLQLQLNIANTKITQAQVNLGVDDLNDLPTELQGEDGDIWPISRWKEELIMEREHAENMDNFYRQQFPFNNNLEHVQNELSKQILEVNQEKQQNEREVDNLKGVVEYFEILAVQTRDNFLTEKIEDKHNQLEQLKTIMINNLSRNFHETLEDVLEAQVTFIQSNNNSTLNQLRRFKQRLLNSGQVNQVELDRICQVQAELSFLRFKQQQEQIFQAQIEIQ